MTFKSGIVLEFQFGVTAAATLGGTGIAVLVAVGRCEMATKCIR